MSEVLTKTILPFVELVDKYLPKKGLSFESIPAYKAVMLDLMLQQKKLIKGLGALIDKNDFLYLNVPMYLICRSLTANALTIYYICSFSNKKGELDNETICNELRALNCDYINFEIEFYSFQQGKSKDEMHQESAEKYPDYYMDGQLKSRMDFHESSDPAIISEMGLKKGMLSEVQKTRVAYSKLGRKIIVSTFLLNKLFTQYYHYNPVGGEWGRITNIGASMDNINTCMVCVIEALLLAIKNVEDILPNSKEAIQQFYDLGQHIQKDILPTLP